MADANRGEIKPVISVKITGDEKSGYKFVYSGDFVDVDGNLNFMTEGARKKRVRLKFRIDEASVKGAQFLPEGREAIWIVEKVLAAPDGCPKGPYAGKQFEGLSTQNGSRTLSLTDKNDDGKVYRYALRFKINGQTVTHDPDMRNDHDPP